MLTTITRDLQQQLSTYYDDLIVFLPKFVLALLLAGIFLLVARWIRKRIFNFFRKKTQDNLLASFIDQLAGITIVFLAILLFLFVIGQMAIASSILGAAGVSAFVIGFAFKDIGENFLAGVMMAFDKPFRIGDTVLTDKVEGVIVEMNLRETHIKTFDGKDVYVPNGQILKNPLYNYTIDGFMRREFEVGVDYDSNVETVRETIYSALAATPGVLTETKQPFSMVSSFGTSSLVITVYFWIDTFDRQHPALEVHSQAMNNVLISLMGQRIGLPGDVIEIRNYKGKEIAVQNKEANS